MRTRYKKLALKMWVLCGVLLILISSLFTSQQELKEEAGIHGVRDYDLMHPGNSSGGSESTQPDINKQAARNHVELVHNSLNKRELPSSGPTPVDGFQSRSNDDAGDDLRISEDKDYQHLQTVQGEQPDLKVVSGEAQPGQQPFSEGAEPILSLVPVVQPHQTQAPGEIGTDLPIVPGDVQTELPLVPGKDRTDLPLVPGKDRTDLPLVTGEDRTDLPAVSGKYPTHLPVVAGSDRTDLPLVSEKVETDLPLVSGKTHTVLPPVIEETKTDLPPLPGKAPLTVAGDAQPGLELDVDDYMLEHDFYLYNKDTIIRENVEHNNETEVGDEESDKQVMTWLLVVIGVVAAALVIFLLARCYRRERGEWEQLDSSLETSFLNTSPHCHSRYN